MPTNEEVKEQSRPFVSLDGKEFTAGIVRMAGEAKSVIQHTHLTGKDFEDAAAELKSSVTSPDALVQIPAAVTILDMAGIQDTDELLVKMARTSGLSADNLLIACIDKASGALTGAKSRNALAVGVNKALVYSKKAEASTLGATNAKITLRPINAIGAIKTALAKRMLQGPVLCVSILASSSLFFVVSEGNVEDLGPAEVGHSDILMQIMGELGLKFNASAARLFFGDIYDFSDKGESLSAALGSKIRTKIEAYKGIRPTQFVICGIPPIRAALFTRHIAPSLSMQGIDAKTLVEAQALNTVPAPMTPELTHLATSIGEKPGHGDFFIDFATIPANPKDIPEDLLTNYRGFVRMYRGTAVDEHGNPVEIHPAHKTPPSAEREPQPRKVVRMYRGTAVYEDEVL